MESGFPFDEERLRNLTGASFDRSYYPQGLARQGSAAIANGYPKASIESIKVPTLVIHGDKDPFMPVEGGRETARLIPGAKLMIIEGMGHDMPKEVWPEITDAMTEHLVASSAPITA